MELFKLFGTIGINGAEEAQRDIDETTQHGEEAAPKMENAFKRIGQAVITYFAVDRIVSFGKAIVEASAEVSAESSAFAQIMGDYSDEAQAKIEQIADATGMVDTRLTPYMTSMTAKFKGLGYDIDDATTLASDGLTLAADASAFWDKSLDDAMSGLNSFINGSYEGGEAIGLFANDTQLASYAVQQGIVGETKEWANLDEARKQATRLQYAQDMYAMSGATGQASKEADQYANVQANLTEKWRQFKAQIGEPILQNIVLPAMEALSVAVDAASDAFQSASQWISEHQTELNLLGGVLVAVTAGVTAFTIAMNWGSIVGAATAALNGARTAILGVNAALAANPIGIVIGLITAAVAAVVYFWNTSEEFRNFVMQLWNTISTAFSGIVTAISTAVSGVITWLTTAWEQFSTWFSGLWTGISTAISNVWNGIVTAVQGAWNTITNIVNVAIQFIGQILSLALDILLIPWNFIWTNFGTYLQSAWDFMSNLVNTAITTIQTIITTILTAIGTFMTNTWNAISNVVSTVWNAISSVISTVVNTIKNFITTAWNAISSTISNVLNTIRSVISSVWNGISSTISGIINGIRNTISSVWNSISSTISSIINGIKNTISNVFNSVKSTVSNVFNGIRSTAQSVWNSIKSAIETPINAAKNTVSSVINGIKGMFNFSWSLPKLKLPHLSITGSFSLVPPSVPKFGISWYAKGGIFDDPTIIPTAQGLAGVGEAGAEAVAPIDVLMGYVRQATREETAGLSEGIKKLIAILAQYLPEIVDGMDRPIVLDDGTLVSKIAPQMDAKLGDINRGRGRGR